MLRTALVATALAVLTGCAGSAGNAFQDSGPTPTPGATAPAALDLGALRNLRGQLAAALFPTRTAGGHIQLTWGSGSAYELAGPYRAGQPDADLLAAAATAGLAPANDAGAARRALEAGATAALHTLDGPDGAAYLLLERSATEPIACASPDPGTNPACLGRQVSDGLLAAYYSASLHGFFHNSDTTTVYRPVDAFAVGVALMVAGYDEVAGAPPGNTAGDSPKISAGENIIKHELEGDLDTHFGMVYGLMRAGASGGRQPVDTVTRTADQAGVAVLLVRAFEASRDHVYLEAAARALQPFSNGVVGLRGPDGYVASFDTRGSGPAPGTVDVEAAALVLSAAHRYDAGDGNHFARLEEEAASVLLGAANRVDASMGLPAAIQAGVPSLRSGVVTAATIVVLGEVLG